MALLKKIKYNSPVILTFVILAFLVLCINTYTNGYANKMYFSVYRSSMHDFRFFIRLFAYVLGHTSWEHFTGNIMLILAIGPMVEEKYGSQKLLIMILFTTLITSLFNLAFFNTGIIGASGIVFMLILLASITQTSEGAIPLTLILVALIYIGGQVISGILNTDNISQLSHILGGACGCIFGLVSRKSE
ncbi:MAG: rhomboid family intramembrane serine protease [Clostridiales bacterium]|nr:rhomboid family intramembrane serine protease [Clostridiales bacterium]